MKLKNKILALSSAIPLVILAAPTFVVSASLNRKDAETKKEEKPKVSPDFNNFKNIVKDKINDGVDKIINLTINYLKNEKNKLINNLDKDFKNNLENLIYIESLIQFLELNKKDILANPSNTSGFTIVFPFVIARNEKYEISEISYNKKTYENVKVGLVENTNYQEQIKPDGKIVKKGDELNSVDQKGFEKLISNYLKALNVELPKMLLDQKDVPKIGQDISIEFKSFDGKGDITNAIKFSVPKNFKTWNEYIVSKLHKKFVDFDLEQNKNFTLEEKQEKDEPISKPDLVPGDKPKKNIDTEEQIQALPNLVPHLSSANWTNSSDSLFTQFNSANQADKLKMFFFDNPINTRYKYSVESLEKQTSNNLIANVKILDQVTKKFRPYKIELNVNTSSQQKSLNFIYEKIIESNKNMFFKIVDALGIDEKINYELLRNDILRDALYNLITAGVSVTNKSNYIQKAKQIISNFATKYLNEKSQSIIDEGIHNSKYLLLTSLFSSTINNSDYFYFLSNSLKGVLLRFKDIVKLNDKIIKDKFNKTSLNLSIINEYYDLINLKISRLIASTRSRTLDIFAWYDFYTKSVKEIMNNFATLAFLVDNKPLTAEKDKQDFKVAYQSANEQVKINNKIYSKTMNKVGYSLTALSSIILLSSLIFISIRKKELKQLKTKKLLITTISIMAIILIAAIIMIIL